MIVRIIGDVHGKLGGYFDILDDLQSSVNRIRSVQIGDMGFGEQYKQRSRRMNRGNKFDGSHHLFFGGNHDDYDAYDQAEGSLGDFGEIPFIPDSFFVRGAKSIDKDQRTVGHDWWREEELDWKRSNEAIERYLKMKPELMFSHDAPDSVAEKMFREDNISSHTSKMLEEMFNGHQPDKWFFGHWHRDESLHIKGTQFLCLDELSYTDLEF